MHSVFWQDTLNVDRTATCNTNHQALSLGHACKVNTTVCNTGYLSLFSVLYNLDDRVTEIIMVIFSGLTKLKNKLHRTLQNNNPLGKKNKPTLTFCAAFICIKYLQSL